MKTFYKIIFVNFFIYNAFVLTNDFEITGNQILNESQNNLVFKNLFIFSTEAPPKDMLLAKLYSSAIMTKMATMDRFNVYNLDSIAEELLKIGLSNIDVSTKDRLFNMADNLSIDGFIEPEIKRVDGRLKIIIKLLDKEGALFAVEEIDNFIYTSKEALFEVASKQLDDLISHIPYMGLIDSIKNDLIFLKLGSKNNLQINDVLMIFEIKEVIRHPMLGIYVDIKKEIIGRVVVVGIEKDKVVTKIRSVKPEKSFLVNMKVDQKIIPKDPFLYPEPNKSYKKKKTAGRVYKSSFGSFEVQGGLGNFKHVFSSDNVLLNQTAKVLPYPEIDLIGDIWITSKWILGLNVMGGVIPIKDDSLNPSSINGIVNNFSLEVKYRINFGDFTLDPQLNPIVGVYRYSFSTDKTSPLKITSKAYYGFSIGGELLVPVDKKYSVHVRGLVYPFARLKEKPQKSGDETSNFGYFFNMGVRYLLKEKLSLTGGLKVKCMKTNFSGTSERLTPNATASIVSMGLYSGVVVYF